MALKAITRNRVRQFESDFDDAKGTDQATVFTVGALSPRLSAMIRDKSTSIGASASSEETTVNVNINSANLEFVRYGLKGWTNFVDEDGNLVEFTTSRDKDGNEVASEESISALAEPVIQELAREINDFNTLSEKQRKN